MTKKYKISLKQFYNYHGIVEKQYYVIKKLIFKFRKLEFWTIVKNQTLLGEFEATFHTEKDAELFISEVLMKGIPISDWMITDIKEIAYTKK